MITLGLEVSGNSLIGVLISGNQQSFEILSGSKLLTIPQGDVNVSDILNFKTDFSMQVDNMEFDQIALCEGTNDSSKQRIRMEFSILSVCEDKNIPYHTYPSNSCTTFINKGFERITGISFSDAFDPRGLNKYCKKAFAVAFKFANNG
jgi:hypothetical protein